MAFDCSSSVTTEQLYWWLVDERWSESKGASVWGVEMASDQVGRLVRREVQVDRPVWLLRLRLWSNQW